MNSLRIFYFLTVPNTEQNQEQSGENENPGDGSGSGSGSGEGAGGSGSGQTETKKDLEETTVYMVGDSTMCSFNDAYYYPRYGYGTQLGNYLDSRATINNLALSGRSSLSFMTDTENDNYQQMVNGLSEGDYLIIGFGHNDEKYDDATRFTSPELDAVETTGSFQNSLYYNYVKVALDAGATPILCTPIVRLNSSNVYTGNNAAHVVSGYGDYAACIRDLAEDYNIACVDLTTLTGTLYTQIGYDEAVNFHAWTTSDSASVDTTHLNIYGAKEVAYLLATELAKSTCKLGDYVLDDIKEPTKADLVVNPDYEEIEYSAPDFENMDSQYKLGTYSDLEWYKTAFGDITDSNAYSTTNGFVGALDSTTGTVTVGQTGSNSRGKVGTNDGYGYVYTPLAAKQQFKISATATITAAANSSSADGTASVSQAAFGIMLRDDIYLPTANSAIRTNYVASGMYNSSSASNIIYSRSMATLSSTKQSVSEYYKQGETAQITLERSGGAQNTTCTVVFRNVTYTYSYYDFDYVAHDYQYCYLCFYATRETVVEFTDIVIEMGELGNA